MKEIIDVNTGEIVVRKGSFILRAMAIGSCVVGAAYESKTKNSAMAHIMLAGHAAKKSREKTRYAANAIEQMLNQLFKLGSLIDDIETCLVGAGNVLERSDDTVCADNIKSITAILAEKKIPIRVSVLGGIERKGIFLDTETGKISYTKGNGQEKLLWQP